MADAAPKLKLDKAGLQDFLDHQVTPFQDSLRKIADDDPTAGPSMASITGTGTITPSENNTFGMEKPLSIGLMGSSGGFNGSGDATTGAALNAKLTTVAKSVITVYTAQTKLFGDLHDNLGTTITTLFDAQHTNLSTIDGKTFLDDLGNLPDDFQPSNTTGTNS
jgi:hypothetical protein